MTVITDEVLARPRALSDVVREALAAGAPTIQLRLKSASARELLEAAQTLMPIVRSAGALFIVNDRLDVALAAGADGVHLGPDDPPVKDVRRVADARAVTGTRAVDVDARSGVADTFIVGYSTDTTDEAARAEAEGADYLGVGAVYATANKSDAGDVIGLEGLRRVVKAVSIPVVAIGGITLDTAPDVIAAGARCVAVISDLLVGGDPSRRVREYLDVLGEP